MSSTFNVKVVVQPNGVKLSKVYFSVHFPDDISVEVEDLPEYIPVQISVQTPGKWAGSLSVVRPIPQDNLKSMFPFLPLHDGFDPNDMNEWKWLATTIQEYLLENRRLRTNFQGCNLFVCELFWMAFVAAYPTFSHGAWPFWDSQITMEGDFVSRWVVNRSDELYCENDDAINFLWLSSK
ncbi:hypothetical protein JVT61DRAFT_1800 [Boletus reticuloceps]|uniref:Uncharacterized protein n=1 Tax=Boletus reticuloceps TaxID=495285 RepID=A0A8I3ABP4_9AGAM|nr:hypothetical protein JVT61DRAFT_1800 [Boletus reticuloceps]